MQISVIAWLSWFVATTFYAYQYVLRVLPNIGMIHISDTFQISASDIGTFSGMYYIGYTLMHIPIAILLDKFSVKKVLPACIAATSIGLLPLIYGSSFTNAILGRLLIGIASSGATLSIFKVVKLGFGKQKFTSMVGLSVTIGLIGAIYGGRPVDYLISVYGWYTIINAFIINGAVLAIVTYFALPDVVETETVDLSFNAIWSDIKTIFSNKKVITLSIISGLMIGPLEGFADAWGMLFFETVYALDRACASTLSSMVFFGMCVGCVVVGYVTDKTGAHIKIIVSLGMIMLIGSMLLFLKLCSHLQVLYAVTFVIGCASAYQLSVLSKVREYTENRLGTLTAAVSNMSMMIFGTIFHNIIGTCMHFYKIESVSTATPEMLIISLSVIPAALCAALLMFFILNLRKFFAAQETIDVQSICCVALVLYLKLRRFSN